MLDAKTHFDARSKRVPLLGSIVGRSPGLPRQRVAPPRSPRKAGVSLYHAILHLHRAAHGINHSELHEDAVAGTLDHAPVVHGDRRVNQIAAESSQPRECAILVSAGKPAISDNVGSQNRGKFPSLGHDLSQ
jgi:hypothetical protein